MYNKTFFLMLCFILLSVSVQAGVPEPSPAGGNYLALDGKDDYAVLDFSKFGVLFKEGTRDLTVEAWIYPTSKPEGNTIAVLFRQQVDIELYGDDTPSYQEIKKRIGWKKGDLLLFMSAFINVNGNIGWTGSRDITLSPYQWHHIAFQLQFPNGAIWICDNQSATSLVPTTVEHDLSKISQLTFMPDKSFVLGGYGDKIPVPESKSFFGSFAGYIDEVRISNIARYDIAEKHTIPQGKFETDANTIALWHFDEPFGTMTFLDSSGNGRNLIGKNGATTGRAFAMNSNGKLTTTWSAIKTK